VQENRVRLSLLAIVSDFDLREAADKVAKIAGVDRTGTSSGTIAALLESVECSYAE
jgi:hypothetical protein